VEELGLKGACGRRKEGRGGRKERKKTRVELEN